MKQLLRTGCKKESGGQEHSTGFTHGRHIPEGYKSESLKESSKIVGRVKFAACTTVTFKDLRDRNFTNNNLSYTYVTNISISTTAHLQIQ
jgi:hypothetical protein